MSDLKAILQIVTYNSLVTIVIVTKAFPGKRRSGHTRLLSYIDGEQSRTVKNSVIHICILSILSNGESLHFRVYSSAIHCLHQTASNRHCPIESAIDSEFGIRTFGSSATGHSCAVRSLLPANHQTISGPKFAFWRSLKSCKYYQRKRYRSC